MKKIRVGSVSTFFFCLLTLAALLLLAACDGVSGTSSATIVGKIQSVDSSAHSITLLTSVNGQQQTLTISGLTDQQISALQAQVGKQYSIQATANGNTYTITTGTQPQEEANATPGVVSTSTDENSNNENKNNNENNGTPEPGSISFIGKVQSTSTDSLTIALPNGDMLTMNLTAQTDRHKLIGQLSQGQLVSVKALATNGTFSAQELKTPDVEEQQDSTKLNQVDFNGVTTSTVGSDNVLHFKVGNQSFSATIGNTTELKDFANVQAINNNQTIKVEVMYNGNNANALKVESSNN